MSVRDLYKVLPVDRKTIADFIEKNHYSGSINGCISDFCFGLYHRDALIGAAFFGRLAMANQWKRFADNIDDVIELRRLCCIDNTLRNTESFFIGKMLRWLQVNTKIKIVVSYADAEYNHSGVIYKASNFEYLGFKSGAKVIQWNGRLYHDKSIRTYYKGTLKPFAQRIKDALESGEAEYKTTAGKHTYVYKFKRKGDNL